MGDPAPGIWGEGQRPARAIASEPPSDFGEGRMGYAASDWAVVSLLFSGKKSSGLIDTPIAGATRKMRRICSWVRLPALRFSEMVWGFTPAACARRVWVPNLSAAVK